jgi:hypothetical protein
MTELQHQRKALSKWRGCLVELWDFRIAHQAISLRIFSPHGSGCLLVFCGATERYCGPLRWTPCDLDIQVLEAELPRTELLYRVFDQNAGFELICGLIEVRQMQQLDPD